MMLWEFKATYSVSKLSAIIQTKIISKLCVPMAFLSMYTMSSWSSLHRGQIKYNFFIKNPCLNSNPRYGPRFGATISFWKLSTIALNKNVCHTRNVRCIGNREEIHSSSASQVQRGQTKQSTVEACKSTEINENTENIENPVLPW